VNQPADSGLSAGEVARRLGVATTTVRTWDRRYGLGPAHREAGRHRRYQQRDVDRLMLMRRLIDDGVAPAEAARIARDAPDVATLTRQPAGAQPTRPVTSATARGLRRAALALDPAELDRILQAALADGVVTAWTTTIGPALDDLGHQHARAGRYIAAEHLLSTATSIALARVPRPRHRPHVLLACTATEQHSLPLEALAAALAERDIAARQLGARVPTPALTDAIGRTGPTSVAIWAHAPHTADTDQLTAVLAMRPRPAAVLACGPGWSVDDLPAAVAAPASLEDALKLVAGLP
jgi:MerR family transcriptional regulator, light-induced transcriptional regulator